MTKRNSIFTLSIAVLPFLALCGCNLYHSSDRDYFDSNGYAGGPAKAALAKPTRSECSQVSNDLSAAALGGLDLVSQNEAFSVERNTNSAIAIMRIARKNTSETTSTTATLCRFEFVEPISEADLLLASRALVETSL